MHILKAFINNKEKKRIGLKNMTFWKVSLSPKSNPVFYRSNESRIIFKQQRLLLSKEVLHWNWITRITISVWFKRLFVWLITNTVLSQTIFFLQSMKIVRIKMSCANGNYLIRKDCGSKMTEMNNIISILVILRKLKMGCLMLSLDA